MEILIDTIDLDQIKEAVEYLPVAGVTSNPSIVKKTAPADFFKHMNEIRAIIGQKRSLHVQVIATDAPGMVAEALEILEKIDKNVYVKIPVSYEGIKAIKILKEKGVRVTATAIYDLMQAYLALETGADYLAPYVNRIGNLGGDPMELIDNLAMKIASDDYDAKIVAASFKGVEQVKQSLNFGAQAITAPVEVLKAVFANPNIAKAIKDFNNDWQDVYGANAGLVDLK